MNQDFDNPNQIKKPEPAEESTSGAVLSEKIKQTESIESEKTIPPEAPDLRIEALEEGIRLTGIGHDSARADLEMWRNNPTTDPSHFEFHLPEIQNRIARAEQSMTSSKLDIEIIKASPDSPEEKDSVVKGFVTQQILNGKTGRLKERLTTLEGVKENTPDLEADKEIIRREIEGILLKGVSDEELPKSLQKDPDFSACLKEADTYASEDSMRSAKARGYKPEVTAEKLFRDRFPQKSAFYDRLLETEKVLQEKSDSEEASQTEHITPEITERKELQDMTLEELKEFRENQSYSERLAEFVTGLRLDDPRFVERLIQDKEIIRDKYGLPNIKMLSSNPREYERELRSMADKLGVSVRSEAEVGQFFIEHPYAAGVHMGDESIVALDIKEDDLQSYKQSLLVLEHELVHANQHAKYPSMPIEMMEYEAYVSSANFSHLSAMDPKERPESLDAFFGMFIGGSVGHWYGTMAVERGLSKNPTWNNADYFLPAKQTLNMKDSELEDGRDQIIVETEKTFFKDGIDFIFSQHPELASIGTVEQYSKYVETIFPDSKFKQIVYHNSDADFKNEGFKPTKPNFDTLNSIEGVYNFSSNQTFTKRYGANTYAVVLDISNPIEDTSSGEYADDMDRPLSEALFKIGKQTDVNPLTPEYDESLKDTDAVINRISGEDYIEKHPRTGKEMGIPSQKIVSVFNLNQIHILGSQLDARSFKEFVEKNNLS